MYKLQCPFCQQAATLPFVRIGAVAACPHCRKRYRIRQANMTRSVRISPLAADQADPLLPDGVALSSSPPTGSVGGGFTAASTLAEPLGLSGLSRLMECSGWQTPFTCDPSASSATPSPAIENRAVHTPKDSTAPATADSGHDMTMVRRRFVFRRHRSWAILAAASCLAAAVVAVVTWQALAPAASTHLVGDGLGSTGDNITILTDLESAPAQAVVVSAQSLTAQPWRVFASPKWFRDDDGDDPIPVVFDDNIMMRQHGKLYFSVVVINKGARMIDQGWVRLILLSRGDWAVAETRVPVALMAAGQDETIRVALPAVATFSSRIIPSMHVAQMTPGMIPLERATTPSVFGHGEHAGVAVEAVNPTPATLQRMMFVLTAVDRDHQPLSRWLVRWNHPIPPQGRISLQAATPLSPQAGVDQWLIRAAGQR